MGFSRSVFNSLNQRPELAKKYVYISYNVSTSYFIAKYSSDGQLIATGPTQSSLFGPVTFEESTDYDNYLYGRRYNGESTILKVDRTTLSATRSGVAVGTATTTILDTGRENLYVITDTFIRFMRKSDLTLVGATFSIPSVVGSRRFPKFMRREGDTDIFAIGSAFQSSTTVWLSVATSDNSTTLTQTSIDSGAPRSAGGLVYDRFNKYLVGSRREANSASAYSARVYNSNYSVLKNLTLRSVPTPLSVSNGDNSVGRVQSFQTSNGDIIYTTPYPTYVSPYNEVPKIYRKTWNDFYGDTGNNVYSITVSSLLSRMSIDDYDHLYVSDGTSLKKYDDYGNIMWSVTAPGSINSIVTSKI
jgi:hypothetical protein